MFAAFFVAAVLRAPQGLLAPAYWNEDPMWYADPRPWVPYMGYLHLAPRVVGWFGHGPLLGNIVALLVIAGTATYTASVFGRAAGAFVILQPAVQEPWGSLTYVQWYFAIALLVGLAGRVAPAFAGIASLTGPFALFLAPLYWTRRTQAAVVLTAGGVVQLIVMVVAPRGVPFDVPAQLPEILAIRAVIEPVFGATWTWAVPVWAAVPLGVLILLCLRRVPWRILAGAGIILAAGMLGSPETTAQLLDPGGAQRYFLIPGFVIGLGAILAARRKEPAGVLLVGLLAVGVLGDLRLFR